MDDLNFYPKISIIIAAYNEGEKLKKCLLSILNQSYKKLEIIIINDGSTDNTHNICENYIMKDVRIKYFYQKNGGVGKARNVGLMNVTGDYITFADDYIEKNLILNYVKVLKNFKKSILISGYRGINNNVLDYEYKNKFEVLDIEKALEILFIDDKKSYRNFLWNKIYPACLFFNLRFEENKTYEDVRIQYKLFELSESIVIIPYIGYNYIYNKGSISSIKNNVLDFVDAQIDRLVYINKKKKNNYLPLLSLKLMKAYTLYCNIFYLRGCDIENKKNILKNKMFSVKKILRYYLPIHYYFILQIILKDCFIIDLIIFMLWKIKQHFSKLYPFSRSPVNLI